MLSEINIQKILFLDIETVPSEGSFENLSEKMQMLWDKKSAYFRDKEQSPGDVYSRAGIYAEFGRIICISAGIITGENDTLGMRIKSYAGDDEKNILTDFASMLEKHTEDKAVYLCAHNGKEFDFPYLARRMLINRLQLPVLLDNAGKKPWEVKHIDTLELWKFGDYKHYTSLELLTTVFDIPSPKNDIDGSMVSEVFYAQKDIFRIVNYCQNDVVAIAQLFLRFKGLDLIPEERVEIVSD